MIILIFWVPCCYHLGVIRNVPWALNSVKYYSWISSQTRHTLCIYIYSVKIYHSNELKKIIQICWEADLCKIILLQISSKHFERGETLEPLLKAQNEFFFILDCTGKCPITGRWPKTKLHGNHYWWKIWNLPNVDKLRFALILKSCLSYRGPEPQCHCPLVIYM